MTIIAQVNQKQTKNLLQGSFHPQEKKQLTLGITGFLELSVVRYSKEHYRTQRSGNWICFIPHMEWETLTLLGPLEKANFSHWNKES
jgi:hypothetical protein